MNPTRQFPEMEINTALDSFGGWLEWLGNGSGHGVAALAWMAANGDELPKDLQELRDTLAQFGQAPIQEVTSRVVGLEEALRRVSVLLDRGSGCSPDDVEAAREIVEMCVKFSGDYGVERQPFAAIFDRKLTEEVAP